MGILAKATTRFGEDRELYIRLNNFEQLANHGVPAIARFRGYYSREAFDAGASFVEEWLVEFPADAPQDPWGQAYLAFEEKAVDAADTSVQLRDLQSEVSARDHARGLRVERLVAEDTLSLPGGVNG